MNEQAKGLAAAMRGFTQDPHKATYEACVTALYQHDLAVAEEERTQRIVAAAQLRAMKERNRPFAYLAAMAPAKGCNCETCRDERRRGLNLNDSNY